MLTKEVQEGVYISVCVCYRRVPDLSGLNQMLSTHLESLSRPVQTDKTPACQEIKACLVDTLELKTMLSVAQVDRERCLSAPLPPRADHGRRLLVLNSYLLDSVT